MPNKLITYGIPFAKRVFELIQTAEAVSVDHGMEIFISTKIPEAKSFGWYSGVGNEFLIGQADPQSVGDWRKSLIRRKDML